MSEPVDPVRELARKHFEQGDPVGWFDDLYRTAAGDFSVIPWADRRPNPNLVAWCEREGLPTPGMRMLVTGCGLGDDAEYLASLGGVVTAFDISAEAIRWCRERWPHTTVTYREADLLSLPQEWRQAFDLVAECYTLQALPDELRPAAIAAVSTLVAPGGHLVTVSRGRDLHDPPGHLPWPLTREELEGLGADGLRLMRFEDYEDPEEAGKRRFRTHWVRPL